MSKDNSVQLNKNKKKMSLNPYLFSRAVEEILKDFPQRSQLILKKRFGVGFDRPLTLSEIGLENSITRERVRQIIQNLLQQIRRSKLNNNKGLAYEVFQSLDFTLSQNSGIIRKKDLIHNLTENKEEIRKNEEGAISLFLACHTEILPLKNYKVEKDTLIKKDFDFRLWEAVENFIIDLFRQKRRVISHDEIIEKSQAILLENELKNEQVVHFLKVSRRVKQNIFGDWGLHDWNEINPRNIAQKAYLVLKKKQKPYHFREVASLIDQTGLNNKTKKSHPQTVHNELIKDKRFVLVGRGIYALAEWGYKTGTVREIIHDILINSSRPLSRKEIIRKVLDQKQVKPSTVSINLSNYFNSSRYNRYFIDKEIAKK